MLLVKIKIHRAEEAQRVLERKLTLLGSFLSFMQSEKIFTPKNLAVWLDAPLKPMGGKLISRIENIGSYQPLALREQIRRIVGGQPATRVIAVIEGEVIDGGERYSSYIALYNQPRLRRVYGDMEFDIYPRGDVEGLYSLYLSSRDFRERLTRVVRQLGDSTPRPDKIVLGYSYDALSDLSESVLAYRSSLKELVVDIFKTIRAMGEESEEYMRLSKILTPYKEQFLARSILEEKRAIDVMKSIARDSGAELETEASAMIAGAEKDSIKRFIDLFTKEILDHVAKQLIDEDRLKKLFIEAIRSYRQAKLF